MKMERFKKLIILVVLIDIIIVALANVLYMQNVNNKEVKINREEKNGIVTYKVMQNEEDDTFNLILINTSLVTMSVFLIFICIYVDRKIIKPFSNVKQMPYELAKGNLSIPIKEDKNKYFGRFLWGMDMLRDNLEENKKKNLAYQKEKKTLILSLSHDIKTPLSAIKLYSKALNENLYTEEEKKKEVYEGILNNADKIEQYVNEIVKNSREDFLDLSVNNQAIYLNSVINKIKDYYEDKLSIVHTCFLVDEFVNCMINADEDRLVEVMQNIMENAIKYGDGKKISISFSEEENYKLITIENTGCNLQEDELTHIFDSFYRGSNSKKCDGSGLGLYICKKLMNEMNGDIFAKIDNNDNTFSVTLVIKKA